MIADLKMKLIEHNINISTNTINDINIINIRNSDSFYGVWVEDLPIHCFEYIKNLCRRNCNHPLWVVYVLCQVFEMLELEDRDEEIPHIWDDIKQYLLEE